MKEGLLKSMRIGQNKDGVVRLVLDVDGARDYSAYLLASPYRLVIEVHAKSVGGGSEAASTAAPAKTAAASDNSDSKSARGSERDGFRQRGQTVSVRENVRGCCCSAKQPATKSKPDNTKTARWCRRRNRNRRGMASVRYRARWD